MFTPIGFFAPQGPTWTPADMNGIQYWWRADLGVTLSGGTVTAWEDQIAGKTLIQEGGSATAPDYVASDTTMNNQAAIEFGNGGATFDSLTDNANRIFPSGTDFPFMWAVFSTTNNGVGGYQVPLADKGSDGAAGQEFIVEFNHPSAANVISTYSYYLDAAGQSTQLSTAARPDTGWIAIGVDNNDANAPGYLWVNSAKQTQWTVGSYEWGVPRGGIAISVGNYGPSGNLPYIGRILEVGFGLEEIDTDSMTNMNAYLNSRYGLSL